MDLFPKKKMNKRQLQAYVGSMDQLAGIRESQTSDGPARNSREFQIWTGSGLSFSVLPDRGLDIADCRFKGISLAWISPIGRTHPAFYEPEADEWLRTYGGGLLVTCGLDQFGYPNVDEEDTLGLHGRISNLPAQFVNYQADWVDERYILEISGKIRQAKVFGENLVLERQIITELGSNAIKIKDKVINEGFEPNPHMILYHFNLGYPLLSEQAQLLTHVNETTSSNSEAEDDLHGWMNFQPPTKMFQEQVFKHQVSTHSDENYMVELKNPNLGLGISWSYDPAQLPYLYQWKMMGQGTYVLGIEPANCEGMHGRAEARKNNSLVYLEPSESRNYTINIEVHEYDGG